MPTLQPQQAPAQPAQPTQPAQSAKPAQPAQPAQPAHKAIPYNRNVEIAQQQLKNMGYELGNTGRWGTGVDGQLGSKTLAALKQYSPKLTPWQAIKELIQKYNTPVQPAKQEAPALPKPQTPSEKAGLYSVEDVYPTEKPPTKTWGAK